MHIYTQTYPNTHAFSYRHIHTYTHTYANTHTHTHILTRSPRQQAAVTLEQEPAHTSIMPLHTQEISRPLSTNDSRELHGQGVMLTPLGRTHWV